MFDQARQKAPSQLTLHGSSQVNPIINHIRSRTFKPAHSAAIAYIKKGQSDKALAYLDYMQAPPHGFFHNRNEHDRRNAVAAVYFALGDYQKTLDMLDSTSGGEEYRNAEKTGEAIYMPELIR